MDAFGFAPRFATWKQANYNDTSIKVEIWRPPAAGNDTTAATKCFRVISAIGCRLRDACTAVSDGQLQLNLSAVPQVSLLPCVHLSSVGSVGISLTCVYCVMYVVPRAREPVCAIIALAATVRECSTTAAGAKATAVVSATTQQQPTYVARSSSESDGVMRYELKCARICFSSTVYTAVFSWCLSCVCGEYYIAPYVCV